MSLTFLRSRSYLLSRSSRRFLQPRISIYPYSSSFININRNVNKHQNFQNRPSYLHPTQIAIRNLGEDGSAQHPNSADHQELTDSAFHEMRFYRYYRFSEKIPADTQQRGFMAASFMFFYMFLIYVFMHFIDSATQPRFWHIRRICRLNSEKIGSQQSLLQWNKKKYVKWEEMCDKSLPELRAKGHDSQTYREYLDECSLHQCLKRDPDFHTSLLHVGFRLVDSPGSHLKHDSALDSP